MITLQTRALGPIVVGETSASDVYTRAEIEHLRACAGDVELIRQTDLCKRLLDGEVVYATK